MKNCYISKVQSKEALKLMGKTCYDTFQLNIVRCNILEEIKIVNREQCLIPCQLRYGNIENIELICIDTGSQTNVISICKLHKVFGKLEFDLQSVTVELKAANNII